MSVLHFHTCMSLQKKKKNTHTKYTRKKPNHKRAAASATRHSWSSVSSVCLYTSDQSRCLSFLTAVRPRATCSQSKTASIYDLSTLKWDPVGVNQLRQKQTAEEQAKKGQRKYDSLYNI